MSMRKAFSIYTTIRQLAAPARRPFGALLAALAAAAMLGAGPAPADDWPQWLGVNRDSVWREDGIVDRFPEGGLRTKWRVPISGGFAGPAVAQGRVYVMDYQTDGDQTPDPNQRTALTGSERVLCLSADSGELIWKHEYDCAYHISYATGPRATPTVHDNLVYTLGAEGDLHCLDAATGKVIWHRDFKSDFGAKTPQWGYAGHPLIDGDKLICVVGGDGTLVVAFNRRTGEEIWRGLDGNENEIGYSAPTLIEHGGRRQLLVWHARALSSLNPDTGERYWAEPLAPNYDMSIVTPRLSGDLLFVGGIINVSMMLKLNPHEPTEQVEWYGTNVVGIDPVHSTPFAEDGYLYGVKRDGKLSAVRMTDGKVLWAHFDLMPENRGVHSGTVFIVKNEERFFLFTDSGELIMARLSPEQYEELGRTKILEPTTPAQGRIVLWSHPAFANGCIYARNDDEIVCMSLAQADY
jgi:outer membrane protein assembly factor BamB